MIVQVTHWLSGLTAVSDVHSHAREAKAQAMARLEALMAETGGAA